MTVTTDIVAAYPLTPMQELMLGLSIGKPDSDACFVQYVLRISGPFDVRRYHDAWRLLAKRHSALRTCFAWRDLEEPLQVVMNNVEVALTELDWSVGHPAVAEEIEELAARETRRGFSLTDPPLLRLVVVKVADEEHQVLLNLHHLIVDGWSVELLLRDVAEYYREPPAEDRTAPDFGNYVDWLSGQDLVQAESYWREALVGLVPGSGSPGALLRPANGDRGELVEIRQELEAGVVEALLRRTRGARITPSTVVRAVWGLLLARYNGRSKAVYAVTVAGRPPEIEGIEGIVGPFLNNIPVVVPESGTEQLDSWLSAMQNSHLRGDRHQWCSPVQIQRWSGINPSQQLCESLLVFQNYPGDHELAALGPLTSVHRAGSGGPSVRTGFPLTLTVTVADSLVLRTTHDTAVLSRPGMQRLHEEFAAVLTAYARGAERLADLPLPQPWVSPATDLRRQRRATVAYEAPKTPLEQRIADLLTGLLDLDEVGTRDNFFDIGGSSVAAMYLARNLSGMLGVDLPIATVFGNPTVEGLATAILSEALRRSDSLPSGANTRRAPSTTDLRTIDGTVA